MSAGYTTLFCEIDAQDRVRTLTGEWRALLAEMDIRDPDPEAALGRSLWELLANEDLAELCRLAVAHVRRGYSLELPFRCDSSRAVRRMSLTVRLVGEGEKGQVRRESRRGSGREKGRESRETGREGGCRGLRVLRAAGRRVRLSAASKDSPASEAATTLPDLPDLPNMADPTDLANVSDNHGCVLFAIQLLECRERPLTIACSYPARRTEAASADAAASLPQVAGPLPSCCICSRVEFRGQWRELDRLLGRELVLADDLPLGLHAVVCPTCRQAVCDMLL